MNGCISRNHNAIRFVVRTTYRMGEKKPRTTAERTKNPRIRCHMLWKPHVLYAFSFLSLLCISSQGGRPQRRNRREKNEIRIWQGRCRSTCICYRFKCGECVRNCRRNPLIGNIPKNHSPFTISHTNPIKINSNNIYLCSTRMRLETRCNGSIVCVFCCCYWTSCWYLANIHSNRCRFNSNRTEQTRTEKKKNEKLNAKEGELRKRFTTTTFRSCDRPKMNNRLFELYQKLMRATLTVSHFHSAYCCTPY